MKKLSEMIGKKPAIIVIKLVLTFLLFTSFKPGTTDVYVCHSTASVAYNVSKNCKGLNRCTHEIIYVSKIDAVDKYGKELARFAINYSK
jgi:hypothetical protein